MTQCRCKVTALKRLDDAAAACGRQSRFYAGAGQLWYFTGDLGGISLSYIAPATLITEGTVAWKYLNPFDLGTKPNRVRRSPPRCMDCVSRLFSSLVSRRVTRIRTWWNLCYAKSIECYAHSMWGEGGIYIISWWIKKRDNLIVISCSMLCNNRQISISVNLINRLCVYSL